MPPFPPHMRAGYLDHIHICCISDQHVQQATRSGRAVQEVPAMQAEGAPSLSTAAPLGSHSARVLDGSSCIARAHLQATLAPLHLLELTPA